MPLKSILLLCLYVAMGMAMTPCAAQDFQNGANLSKHTIGYAIGYTYPKFADGSDDVRIAWDFNYGFSGAFEWGKYYKSGISFMIAPLIYYSDFNNTLKTRDWYHSVTGKLTFRKEWNYNYRELAFALPLSYEFPMFKAFRFGAGAYFSMPLISGGSSRNVDYDYYVSIPGKDGIYVDPPRKKEYPDYSDFGFDPSIGVNGKILYQIQASEKVESYISIEYWYDISSADNFYAHKTRFALCYIHRMIQLKDVREKWDRYLIRKDRN